MSLMRDLAGRAPVAARHDQAAGRHERRPHLVEGGGGRVRAARPARTLRAPEAAPAGGVRATRGARHAARAGRTQRARRLAGQARAWWTEATERVSDRARERWTEQAAARPTGRRVVTPAPGEAGWPPASGQVAGIGAAGRTRGAASGERTSHTQAGPAPRHLAAVGRSRRAGRDEDLVAGWCSVLVVLGLYLDGFGHGRPTLWHGVLALGLVATAAWILTREQRPGAWSPRAVPAGHRLALAGIVLAMAAVAGDAAWHTLVGPEQGLARLVAPFHLVLFAGACLLISSTLRAAWSGPSSARVPGLGAFWPVLLSATALVAMTAFFFAPVSPVAGLAAGSAPAGTLPLYQLLGLLAHNLLFVAPVLLLLLRWQTPLGTFTILAGSVALLPAAQAGLGLVGLAGAAVLGGAAADVAVHLLRPSPQRRWAARAVGALAPAVYWTAHFALAGLGYRATVDLETWFGSVVWASLSGLTLALLMWPPAVPLTAWNRGRGRPRATAPAAPTPMPARMVGR
jgi:hypothetical protein